jgi:hypothetical protein
MLSDESGMKLQIDIQFTDYGPIVILHHITLNFPDIITEFHFIFTLLFLVVNENSAYSYILLRICNRVVGHLSRSAQI